MTNAATFNPASTATSPTTIGTITITGTYTQTSAGTLNVDLGAASCTTFDALSVSGNVSLAGTLNVTPGAGCTPTAAQTFDVVASSGGTASGNFATVTTGYTTAVVGGNTLRLTKS